MTKLEHSQVIALAHYVQYECDSLDIGDEAVLSLLIDSQRFILTCVCTKNEDDQRVVRVTAISSYNENGLISFEVPSFLEGGI